jgi:His-Xaa-Ser system protein HxsD
VSLIAWTTDDAHVALPIDLTLYTLPAVMRASYKMTDRVFVYLQRDSENPQKLWVYFFGRSRTADAKPLVLEFLNELTDQQLRVQLDQQFHDVRTLIVAQAFAEGDLLTPADEHVDYRTDTKDAGKHR